VAKNGTVRDGRNGETRALFTKHIKIDLRDGFPLLTTKKMYWKGIVEELLFFLRGDTNSKILEEKGVFIWNGNTNREFLDRNGFSHREEGVMGPMYGYQWRHYGAEYDEKTTEPSQIGIDQLANIVEKIREDPHSRRILMVDYNPTQVDQGVLYPCHSIVLQFFVDREYLDMFCYNRSSDLFLGLPFNIASTALLMQIVAEMTELTPRFMNISLGDAHIYKEHLPLVQTQIERTCYSLPSVKITKDLFNINDIETLTFSDFELHEYNSHPSIKAKMIA